MSKDTIVSLLSNVVTAARTYANAGNHLTKAAMLALQGGASVEDVIEAVRGGFEEAGEVIPAAFASNLRRVAKAKMMQEVIDSDRSLNNNLLIDLNVPKADSAKGAPAKAKAKADPAKANDDKVKAESPADPVTILRGLIAKKTQIVDIADVDRFENALTEALACLTRVK